MVLDALIVLGAELFPWCSHGRPQWRGDTTKGTSHGRLPPRHDGRQNITRVGRFGCNRPAVAATSKTPPTPPILRPLDVRRPTDGFPHLAGRATPASAR